VHKISDLDVGKAAEHLVVCDLILGGHNAFLTEQGMAYDVVVEFEKRLVRVQVKSTRCQRAVPQRLLERKGYLFHHKRTGKNGARSYSGGEFDIFAFVALDIRCVAYLAFTDAPTNCLILRPPGQLAAVHAQRRENIDQLPFDVAVKRWEAFTGKTATLQGDGSTFKEIYDQRSTA
jgi:hypothetical protein